MTISKNLSTNNFIWLFLAFFGAIFNDFFYNLGQQKIKDLIEIVVNSFFNIT